jgi:hypothetical protein
VQRHTIKVKFDLPQDVGPWNVRQSIGA